MVINCDIALQARDRMTSHYTSDSRDGTITVWPTWTGKDSCSLRIKASPEQLGELRDLIDNALNEYAPRSETFPVARSADAALVAEAEEGVRA